MGRNYDEYLTRKRHEHGERFDPSELAQEFVRYFESGERIKVELEFGETLTGTVGVTTGWRPAFLLIRRSDAHGSPWLLGNEDHVVAVKRGRNYQEV